jgi:hypothetical protein
MIRTRGGGLPLTSATKRAMSRYGAGRCPDVFAATNLAACKPDCKEIMGTAQIVGRGAFHAVVQRRQPFFFPSIMPAVAIVESLARVLECITPPFRQNPWAPA